MWSLNSSWRPSLEAFAVLCLLPLLVWCQDKADLNLVHAKTEFITTVFRPLPDPVDLKGSLYTRFVVLDPVAGSTVPRILLTYERDIVRYDKERHIKPVQLQVRTSDDGGRTFETPAVKVKDKDGKGLRWQPMLYRLPDDFGKLKKGTILLASNQVPQDHSSTALVIYTSTDEGKSWTYLSTVDVGGAATPDNQHSAIWEPFLLLHNDQLICYYSSQQDYSKHGQMVVHRTIGKELDRWSAPVVDVLSQVPGDRPGMPVVAQMSDGRFVMTFEFGGSDASKRFKVYYKVASDPLQFGQAEPLGLVDQFGKNPTSSPYVIWATDAEGQGMLVVSCGTESAIWVNRAMGDAKKWERIETQVPVSYSRALAMGYEKGSILLSGGGRLSDNDTSIVDNRVSFSMIRLPQLA